jgi:hypothetical protein
MHKKEEGKGRCGMVWDGKDLEWDSLSGHVTYMIGELRVKSDNLKNPRSLRFLTET